MTSPPDIQQLLREHVEVTAYAEACAIEGLIVHEAGDERGTAVALAEGEVWLLGGRRSSGRFDATTRIPEIEFWRD